MENTITRDEIKAAEKKAEKIIFKLFAGLTLQICIGIVVIAAFNELLDCLGA